MTKGRQESAGGKRKERHKGRKAGNLVMAAAARITWMFKAKGCPHICLFCGYYRQCREDGIPGKGDEQR